MGSVSSHHRLGPEELRRGAQRYCGIMHARVRDTRVSGFLVAPRGCLVAPRGRFGCTGKQFGCTGKQFGCTEEQVWLHRRRRTLGRICNPAAPSISICNAIIGLQVLILNAVGLQIRPGVSWSGKTSCFAKKRPTFFHERPTFFHKRLTFFHERPAFFCPRPWDKKKQRRNFSRAAPLLFIPFTNYPPSTRHPPPSTKYPPPTTLPQKQQSSSPPPVQPKNRSRAYRVRAREVQS